ncbi:MAG TPA: cytidylate kinase-like family protein [Syntrophales bacterium]|nr:cytidylate kinase-like family protein [Syntrophales bacterium]
MLRHRSLLKDNSRIIGSAHSEPMDETEVHMGKEKNIAVTISRQMGSGGSYVGYLAAKELGWRYVDREVLQLAAERLGTNTRALEELDEKSLGILKNIIRGFSFSILETAYVPPMTQPIYDRDLFSLECKIMNQIIDEGSAVIIGRGGFHALKDRPGLIRIFLHAPKEFRVNRIMTVGNMKSRREALAQVEESDRTRAKFIGDMIGVNWTDARNYHLSVDSSTVDFATSVEMIIKLVNRKRALLGKE